jgi:3-deoxy-7-phosphoheptulonate synthase
MSEHLPDLQVLRRCWPEYSDPTSTKIVRVNGVDIGGTEPVIIAGPCAVESFEQTYRVAAECAEAGATLMRGGAFKPRTSPHSFQGLGVEGLEILAKVREKTGLGIVTEVMDPRLVETAVDYADMIQIGSRSMQNFPLLKEVGTTRVPILLKRGFSSTLEEWLCSAEYVADGGNLDIVLCERGIRASCHWSYARNIIDLGVIEPVRCASPLPIIVDPSHGTGEWRRVAAMSRASLATGAHGLLIEVVDKESRRAELSCDGEQGITPDILQEIVALAKSSPVPAVCA